jgi:hypothetical protein
MSGVTAPFDVAHPALAGRPAVIVNSQGASRAAPAPTEGWDHAVLDMFVTQARRRVAVLFLEVPELR